MPALPISVFIIARNEADRIALTIDSVKDWVDEVIVVDSGSDDDTVALERVLGARRTVFNAMGWLWTTEGVRRAAVSQ